MSMETSRSGFAPLPAHSLPFTPTVPNELWRLVFRFATTSPESSRLYDVDFAPFRESWLDSQSLDNTLGVKKAIISVCRTWRELGLQFFWEHATTSMVARLIDCSLDNKCRALGRYVRRLELPSRQLQRNTKGQGVRLEDILRWCPRVEILVQPKWSGGDKVGVQDFWGDPNTWPSTPLSLVESFKTLKRIDWCTLGNEGQYPAHRALLAQLLSASPNLRYLSLRYGLDPFPGPSFITLPSLATLHLQGEIGLHGLCLPNLEHLIVNHIQVASEHCVFSRIGPKLKVLQLSGYGDGHQFDVFRLSPDLAEFCCGVNRETVFVMGCLHPRLHTVRLNCSTYPDGPAVEGFRKKSVMLYDKVTFPNLERVVLHGEAWTAFAEHPEFRLFRLRILDRGCGLVHDDGQAVM
ncbi:hypothetical protein Hypma_003995 [Hypsizygus marmoreus]|uniref:F-box domain-containing protein n=1 Tax=Hypsizygus marmoreus TaxID=39966 RepID=A0A369J4W0_HYPMA|nr:hypothetical protein Hypma_003995 [Hypsizygus marmoreus]